jgi:hypothetical protein
MSSAGVTYQVKDYYGDGVAHHVWEVADADGIACELYVSLDRLEVMQIETREDRRSEGLARLVYETAAAQMAIVHAPVAHRTVEGDAFAHAVGGDVAEYVCDCAACDTTDDEE